MPIDKDKGPGGIDSSYGRRLTLATRAFDTLQKYGEGFVEGITTGAPTGSGGGSGFTLNPSTGFAETEVDGSTFLALPKQGPNARANVNLRTGTFSQLATLVGGAGEVAVCTDQNALFVYDGVSAGGNVYRQPSQIGVAAAQLVFPESTAAAERIVADSTTLEFYTQGVLSQAANPSTPEIALNLPSGIGATLLRVEGRQYRAVQHNVIPSTIDEMDALNIEYNLSVTGGEWVSIDSLYYDASREISYGVCSVALQENFKRIRLTLTPQATSPSYCISDLQIYVYTKVL
jgi:Major tropism determinant N-terminal domain